MSDVTMPTFRLTDDMTFLRDVSGPWEHRYARLPPLRWLCGTARSLSLSFFHLFWVIPSHAFIYNFITEWISCSNHVLFIYNSLSLIFITQYLGMDMLLWKLFWRICTFFFLFSPSIILCAVFYVILYVEYLLCIVSSEIFSAQIFSF